MNPRVAYVGYTSAAHGLWNVKKKQFLIGLWDGLLQFSQLILECQIVWYPGVVPLNPIIFPLFPIVFHSFISFPIHVAKPMPQTTTIWGWFFYMPKPKDDFAGWFIRGFTTLLSDIHSLPIDADDLFPDHSEVLKDAFFWEANYIKLWYSPNNSHCSFPLICTNIYYIMLYSHCNRRLLDRRTVLDPTGGSMSETWRYKWKPLGWKRKPMV